MDEGGRRVQTPPKKHEIIYEQLLIWVMQMCERDVMGALKVMLAEYYRVIQGYYIGVEQVLQRWYRSVTKILKEV